MAEHVAEMSAYPFHDINL